MAIASIPEKRRNFFIRLIKGEISLPVTYWVFGYFVGILIALAPIAIQEYGMLNGEWKSIAYIIPYLCSLIFYIFYSIFIFIAIWNSADNYKGKTLWANLAKFAVLLGIGRMVKEICEIFN